MSIAFDDNVPGRGPGLWVKRMEGAESKTFVIYSSSIRGIWTHWNASADRSEPHYEENCTPCKHEIPKRWKGYLHCFCPEEKRQLILELTPTAAESLKAQVDDPDQLRGTLMRVKRSAASNGRLQITILERVQALNTLPKEKDPRRDVLLLWGLKPDVVDRLLGGEGPEDPEE